MTSLAISPLPELPDLEAEVRLLLQQLPPRKVTTFGSLAKALGAITASKWIAHLMLETAPTPDFPSHRVVRAEGILGDYLIRSAVEQGLLLQADGIEVCEGRVDLDQYGFDDFQTESPLRRLADWQLELAGRVIIEPRPMGPGLDQIGAVDVSYGTKGIAVAGYAVTDLLTGELIWSHVREQKIRFPYISGFLGFRELPALVPLIEEVHAAGKLAEVLIVDGNGTLHARGVGVASHLGVVTGLPTIGVSKTLPFGQVDLNEMQPQEARPIVFEGRTVGMAVRPRQGVHPLFVSPGHRIDLETSVAIVTKSLHSQRLPAPQFWADRLSREATRKQV